MNPRHAPCAVIGSTGLWQSGNSVGRGVRHAHLDPAQSNADIWFDTAPIRGQE
jgi:hypothetical protein